MANNRIGTAARTAAAFLTVPWGAFVVAFLFYVVLTLVAIGGQDLPDAAMAVAYLAPVAAYLLVLLSRLLHAVASLPVQIGQLSAPRLQ